MPTTNYHHLQNQISANSDWKAWLTFTTTIKILIAQQKLQADWEEVPDMDKVQIFD